MALTTEQKAVLQRRLTEAEEAYHLLQMGRSARVFVDQNGERIEYTAANSTRLAAYILSLKKQLGTLCIPGPMGVML
jgi:hypothetical protein